MANYIIGTSSTSDLPLDYIQKHGLLLMKYTFILDHKEYKDGDLSSKAFYDLERDGNLPTTSQLTPEEIANTFEPVLAAGNDLLHIEFSSGLSGSCNNVQLVAEELREKYPQRKLIVIDSLCASLGLGLLVDYAVRLREAGKSIDETAKWVEANKLGLNHWFTVDSLSHLHRGGRVSGAAAFVGNLLHIKPVLNVDHEGHLIPREKEQGRRKALRCLVEKMEAHVYKPEGQRIFISHSDDEESAQKVAEMVRGRFPDIADIMTTHRRGERRAYRPRYGCAVLHGQVTVGSDCRLRLCRSLFVCGIAPFPGQAVVIFVLLFSYRCY
jgi:DegV family protein with EDD domain